MLLCGFLVERALPTHAECMAGAGFAAHRLASAKSISSRPISYAREHLMLTREQAKKLTERALSLSKFPECEISVTQSERSFIRFGINEITTSGFTVEPAMSITSTRD